MRSFQITLAVSLVALCAAAAAPLRAQVTVAPSPGDSSAAIAGAFDQIDRAELALSPIGKMNRGIRDGDYGKWDDFSEAGEAAGYRALADAAASLRHDFDPARLSPKDAMSFRLFQSRAKRAAAYDAVRSDVYAFHQHLSWQSSIPALLVNQHSIANEAQAEAYVARIAGLGAIADAKTDVARARAADGVIPPKWVFPLVLSEVDGILKSDAAPDLAGNALIDDFRAKIAKLDLPEARKAVLIQAAISAWTQSAAPAFRRFRAEVAREEPLAGTVDGVWRLPNGKQYYDTLLAWHTTTDLNADQIHELGLSETARIQDEMRGIMRKVGFAGTLQQFFDYTRTDPRFFHATREAYLADAQSRLDAATAKLPDWFVTLPKDRLLVKAVEPFREKVATKAFYGNPSPDGSRPGTYYVNLYNLKEMSKNEVEALAFHEGIPGHHLQRSIQYGLGEVPAFRRFGFVTAYIEGWGLYAEQLAKEMGFYTDPYGDFGRLSMEILRAGRLVTDTGIHAKRWSRAQAIDWYMANTPVTRGDVVNQVERFVVFPGQATAYTVGKLKILALRERARAELGTRFDIRQFHDVVLKSGPVPLDILEENVDAWIASASVGEGTKADR